MQFISIPTEQTTAITDAILGLEAVFFAGYFQRFVPINPSRVRCWQMLLLLTALASFMGTVAHGLEMSKATYELLWKPLLILLGLMVANIILVSIYDWLGHSVAKRAWPWLLGLGLGFFAVTFIPGVTFFIFIAYEALGLLFGLTVYLYLTAKRRVSGSAIIALGIILQLIAAVAQALGPYQFQMIYSFDQNGAFHLIAMGATCMMAIGAFRGFKNKQVES